MGRWTKQSLQETFVVAYEEADWNAKRVDPSRMRSRWHLLKRNVLVSTVALCTAKCVLGLIAGAATFDVTSEVGIAIDKTASLRGFREND